MATVELNMNWKTITTGIVSILTILGLVVSGVFTAEARYVNSEELIIAQTQMTSDINSLQKTLETNRIKDRIQDYVDKKQYVQDKVIDGTATPTDKKRIYRYDESIKSLEKELDRL